MKAEALERYLDEGPGKAAEALGIPRSTISVWAKRSGLSGVPQKSWAEQRLEVADMFGIVARKAIDLTNRLVDEGETNKAKQAITTAAIAVDKAQLLSGGPTSMVGHADLARIAELAGRLNEAKARPQIVDTGEKPQAIDP